nr:hypothetical protein [Idiomarina xiamenensis]
MAPAPTQYGIDVPVTEPFLLIYDGWPAFNANTVQDNNALRAIAFAVFPMTMSQLLVKLATAPFIAFHETVNPIVTDTVTTLVFWRLQSTTNRQLISAHRLTMDLLSEFGLSFTNFLRKF